MTKANGMVEQERPKALSLDEELLAIIANQVKWSPYPIALAMGIIAYMMYTHIPDQPWIWGGWFAMVLLTQAYRMVRLPDLPQKTDVPVEKRKREAALLNIAGIGIQSLSLLAFPMLTPFEASVQTIMFVGMGVGSIVTAVGWAPYTLSHIWLTLVPAYSLWLWSGISGTSGIVGVMVAIVGFAYSFTMWMISKRLYHMHEELFANRAALAVALDKAEAAGIAKTRFLASSSHDLRQPIHALSLLSSALDMQNLDKRTREISDNIESAVDALSSELDSLLDISKLDAGVVPVKAARINLNSIIERLCRDADPYASEKGIAIELEQPEHSAGVTDPALFERIVRNVLTNAIAHNTTCTVSVRINRAGSHWEVEIEDTGSGVPIDEQEKIFEEFYQLQNPERDRHKGLGLGLSIVQRLSQLLGLGMKFESSSGLGTRFRFYVPVADAPQTLDAIPDTAQIEPGSLHVLVVDDEAAVRESMKILLESMEYKVSSVESTETALEFLTVTAQIPNIVLIDYRLRGSDSGLQTLARIREGYPDMPVILISGDTAPDRLKEAETAGIPLLTKPVRKQALCLAIDEACGT